MVSTAPLRMIALGSGSSGNAIAVTDGATTVLVDCGLSAREVACRLRSVAIEPATIEAVLVTHEHGDHVRGIDVFTRRDAPGCRVLATHGTLVASGFEHAAVPTEHVVAGSVVRVGSLTIVPFSTSHDAAEPVGYRIESGGHAIGIATDTGVLTPEALEALAGCELIGIESNHDLKLLEMGPYPAHLKRRIRSEEGHLSNAAAADALETLAHDGLRTVFALHRSRTNNTADLAGATLFARLARIGLPVPVVVAAQDAVCDSDPP